ncbi:LacI family transcriptional regulator [Sediminibacterium roseum]|uniref:LacI family transcriptional regulator n=1 Tax=Sediminibacterium roseum TaxID=1978412 RepID=A0ABW9ZSB3_9BACT|nr:LacI family DNA-binding transcriptional regulator [Sediminibacterium roseum]NCI49410.1 LacI family transcriptional regulator [Sediminibacterium roseum]
MKETSGKSLAGVKEIAKRANVSIATVDRVIHNRTGVSAKTKEKIQQIIDELGYQPNVLAQRLALTTRGTIRLATLLPNISDETEFWRAPLDGIRRAELEIRQYGIHVEHYFFDQNNRQSFARQVARIKKYKPDGLLFTPVFPEESKQLIKDSATANIPCVLINSDLPGFDNSCYIGPDIFHSGYLSAQLVSYCVKGNKPVLIANIAREIDNNYAILDKEHGFRTYFSDHKLANPLISFNTTQTDYTAVKSKLSKLFKKHEDIAAIFVTNSRVSVVARCLEDLGKKKVLLLGHDFTSENVHSLERGLIDFLICEKPEEQGYRGITTLFQNLVFSKEIEKTYLMPIDIITRHNYRYYRN